MRRRTSAFSLPHHSWLCSYWRDLRFSGPAARVMSVGPFVSLFDGTTLQGWHAVPRRYGPLWPVGPDIRTVLPELSPDYDEMAMAHPAHWEVVGGAIEGIQDPAQATAAPRQRPPVRRLRAPSSR